jgi:hypothetical protein
MRTLAIDAQNPKINSRRRFISLLGAGAAALVLPLEIGASFLASGCSFASVFDQIKLWVPLGLGAVGSIVSLIPGLQGLAPIIALVQAGLGQILSDVSQYENTAGATLLSKIQAGLSDVVKNLQTFLQSVNISDPTLVAMVTGLAQIILTTIADFQQKLVTAGAPPPASPATRVARIMQRPVTIVPHARTNKQFIADFNAQLGPGHKDFQIH